MKRDIGRLIRTYGTVFLAIIVLIFCLPINQSFASRYSYDLTRKNIVKGYPDGKLNEREVISRAEIAVMLTRASGVKVQKPITPTFKDVGPEHWAFELIEGAVSAGLINIYLNDYFSPDAPVTRAEAAALLLSFTKESLPIVRLPSEIIDVNPTHWAVNQIAASLDADILNLVNENSFAPDALATRGEVVRGLAILMTITPRFSKVPLVGSLVPKKGEVVLKNNNKKPQRITDETACSTGDIIITGPNGIAELTFSDGSGFRIEENTELIIKEARGQLRYFKDDLELTVDRLELSVPQGKIFGALAARQYHEQEKEKAENTSSIEIKKHGTGKLLAAAGPLSSLDLSELEEKEQNSVPWWKEPLLKKVRVKVDMPWGVAGVRGTFWMNEVSTGRHRINTINGSLEVTANGKTVVTKAGQSTSINSPNEQPTIPTGMTPEELQSWAEVRDWVQGRTEAIEKITPLITEEIKKKEIQQETDIIPKVESTTPPITTQGKSMNIANPDNNMTELSSVKSVTENDLLQVMSSIPSKGAEGVAQNKEITLIFSKNIWPGTKFGDIFLKSDDSVVNCTNSISGNRLMLRPLSDLPPGKICDVNIPGDAIKDLSGHGLVDDYSFRFTTSSAWHTEKVLDLDLGDVSVNIFSLALDASGNPYVACPGKYLYRDLLGWHVEKLDNSFRSSVSSMAIDTLGKPHISYHYRSGEEPELRYAYRNAFGWHIETVDSKGGYNSIAVDSLGRTHIAYVYGIDGHLDLGEQKGFLKYTFKDFSGWHTEIVDNINYKGQIILILDSLSRPHIFYNTEIGVINYAYKDVNGWKTEFCGKGFRVSAALDSLGKPHISYFGTASGEIFLAEGMLNDAELNYAFRDASGWHTNVIEKIDWLMPKEHSFMKLDEYSNPHISYFDNDDKDLRYLYKNNSGWHNEAVDSTGSVGRASSLVLDTFNNPHFIYYDGNNKCLKYANRYIPTTPLKVSSSDPLDVTTGVSVDKDIAVTFSNNVLPGNNYDSIVVTADNKPVAVNYSLNGNMLVINPVGELSPSTTFTVAIPAGSVKDYVGNTLLDNYIFTFTTSRAWQIETVDIADFLGCDSSIVVNDLNGKLHLAYRDSIDVLKYAREDSDGWHFETVDNHTSSYFITMVLDKLGNPHICYFDNGSLKHAYRDALSWNIETIENGDDFDRINQDSFSMTLDAYNNPHIIYVSQGGWLANQGVLKYAYRDTSGWHIEIVERGYQFTSISICLDRFGNPHICYGYGDLMHAYRDASGWHTEVVDTVFNIIGSPSPVISKTGELNISYFDSYGSNLKYAYKAASGWQVENVDIAGKVGIHSSLALDAAGNPYISYYDETNGNLKFAHKNSDGCWQIETVECSGDVGRYPSLAMDSIGNIFISYIGHTSSKTYIKIARLISSVDTTKPVVNSTNPGDGEKGVAVERAIVVTFSENVLSGANFGGITIKSEADSMVANIEISRSILTINPVGELAPNTTYRVYIPDGALEGIAGNRLAPYNFIFTTMKAWPIQTVDRTSAYTTNIKIALDTNENPHICYDQLESKYLKYAYQDASGWHVETVDKILFDYNSGADLAMNLFKNPCISFLSDGLKYAWKDQMGWHIETVEKEWTHGFNRSFTRITLDASANPHIICYDQDYDFLGYAYKDNTGWHVETVYKGESKYPVFEERICEGELTVDSQGNPCISYVKRSQIDKTGAGKSLLYVYNDSSKWHIETVDGTGCRTNSESVTVDAFGIPHICYFDRFNHELKYAYRESSGWQVETVENGIDYAEASIALDTQGNPYICYNFGNELTIDDLKIAYKDASGWHNETIDSAGRVGNPSIAIGASGNIYISYSDDTNKTLKYVCLDKRALHPN